MTEFYRLLGFTPEEIKTSYRRLVRQYHPDLNPENQQAKAKFIRLTEAYEFLLSLVVKESKQNDDPFQEFINMHANTKVVKVTEEQSSVSEYEQQLKWDCYKNLQKLLKEGKFALAIALVEGLVQRRSQDLEVLQWQAIAYHQWGRQLAYKGQLDKAKVYFKKALLSDPHNRSLWSEIEQDCRRLKLL